MVGVAGKSKGCATCRRRKVRCDLGQPICRNCESSNRQCGGYERYPVFVNRTLTGVQKRQPLEEAKIANPASTRDLRGNRKNSVDLVQVPAGRHSTVLTHTISPRVVEDAAIISKFWESFVPSPESRGTGVETDACLGLVVRASTRSQALQQILLALATTRFGRVQNNLQFTQRGQQMYGQALRSLQKALNDSELIWQDDTLATVRLMLLYEYFETSDSNPDVWHTHLSGLSRLVQMRGPQRHTTELSQAVLKTIRAPLMIQSLMRRRKSFLADPVWHNLPWIETSRDIEQCAYNCGFTLGSLLEEADRFATTLPSAPSLNLLYDYLTRLDQVHQNLKNLSTSIWPVSNTHFRCHTCGISTKTGPIIPPDDGRGVDVISEDLNAVMLFVLLQALQLVLAITCTIVCQKVRQMEAGSPVRAGMMEDIEMWSGNASRMRTACNILDITPHFLHDEVGYFAHSKANFPLQCVRWEVRKHPQEATRCQALLQKMASEKMLPFALNVNKKAENLPLLVQDAVKSDPSLR